MSNHAKKIWVSPELCVYGSIEDITQQVFKSVGIGDGVILVQQNGPNVPLTPAS